MTFCFKKMVSNIHHHGPFIDGDSILGYPRYKPLTYFCFDLMETDGELETVAVTCPRHEIEPEAVIYKCCPLGETIESASLSGCRQAHILKIEWYYFLADFRRTVRFTQICHQLQ